MNITSSTASDMTNHSASELDSVMLYYAFDHQETGAFKTYSVKLFTHLLMAIASIITIAETNDFPWFACIS